tara:strand:+ start:721 stop:1632 length:912 start_codon:yes stop_codon:yes gene_type:complete
VSARFSIEQEGYPDLPAMMLATVEALKSMGGSASIHELDEKVAELEELSEAEQSFTMSGTDPRPRLNYYLAWSRTFLKRGGALENSSRGVWALTDFGESISQIEQTRAIQKQVNDEERERARQKRHAAAKIKKVETDTNFNLEEERDSLEVASWNAILLSSLRSMDPSAFERLSQRLLREAGFTKVEVRGKSGDGGIDGIGILRVNLVSFQVLFQCKRWKGSVGAQEIRDFRGGLQGRADKGLFITTGNFTQQASEEATRDGAIAIDLIDGDRLCDLLKQYELGVRTKLIEEVTVDKSWFEKI